MRENTECTSQRLPTRRAEFRPKQVRLERPVPRRNVAYRYGDTLVRLTYSSQRIAHGIRFEQSILATPSSTRTKGCQSCKPSIRNAGHYLFSQKEE